MNRDVSRVIRSAVGSEREYCTGAGFAPADCYVTAQTISIGIAPCLPIACGSAHLNHTVAYDAAEVCAVNLGQTNMIAVSSFCGVNGVILGHDLLKVEHANHPEIESFDGMQVLDLLPLEEAAVALFGTVRRPQFPFAPGEHVPCAYKTFSIEGEGVVWGALALAIARDRRRNADLFMEELGGERGIGEISEHARARILASLLRSVSQVGLNLNIEYKEVYVGIKQAGVPSGYQGCALTAVPYFKMARGAVCTTDAAGLANTTLREWSLTMGDVRERGWENVDQSPNFSREQ